MRNKGFTCFMSFGPIVLIIIAMAGLFGAFGEVTDFLGISFVLLTLFAVVLCWIDIIWFIVITFKRKEWSTQKKIVWTILLYMLNVFIFPVYWWMCLRKD